MTFLRWLLIISTPSLFCLGIAWAQTVLNPQPSVAVCAYNSVLPTATASGFVTLQCNSSGQVILH